MNGLVQSVSGLPYWLLLAIFAAVVLGYTAFGGFTAVVITDTIQGIIMLVGTFLLPLNPPDIIFWVQLFAMGGLECAFFWPLVGGVLYKKGNKHAALWSSVLGVLVYMVSYQFKLTVLGINSVVWGLLASGIVYFLVGELTCRNGLDQDILDTCF